MYGKEIQTPKGTVKAGGDCYQQFVDGTRKLMKQYPPELFSLELLDGTIGAKNGKYAGFAGKKSISGDDLEQFMNALACGELTIRGKGKILKDTNVRLTISSVGAVEYSSSDLAKFIMTIFSGIPASMICVEGFGDGESDPFKNKELLEESYA